MTEKEKLISEFEKSFFKINKKDMPDKETIKNGVYAYFESIKDKANIQNQFKFITI